MGPYGHRMGPYGHRMGPHGTVWALMEPYGTVWALMKPYGHLWDRVGFYGTIWAPYGLLLNRMGTYETVWVRVRVPIRSYGPIRCLVRLSHKCPYGSIRAHTVPIRSHKCPYGPIRSHKSPHGPIRCPYGPIRCLVRPLLETLNTSGRQAQHETFCRYFTGSRTEPETEFYKPVLVLANLNRTD